MQAADTATIRFDPNGQPQALQRAVAFLKVLGHEGRLELLCHMIDGAQSVGALTQALGSSQPAVSQHLMRLRAEGLESFRLDYADDSSVAAALNEALTRTGGTLDAVFNNGAFACPGAVEDLPTDALRAIFETNLFE